MEVKSNKTDKYLIIIESIKIFLFLLFFIILKFDNTITLSNKNLSDILFIISFILVGSIFIIIPLGFIAIIIIFILKLLIKNKSFKDYIILLFNFISILLDLFIIIFFIITPITI